MVEVHVRGSYGMFLLDIHVWVHVGGSILCGRYMWEVHERDNVDVIERCANEETVCVC